MNESWIGMAISPYPALTCLTLLDSTQVFGWVWLIIIIIIIIIIKELICITKYLNAWILRLFILFYCDIVLLNSQDNIIQSLLKISLIWCYKFNCKFKYIYINKKQVLF